MPRKSKVSIEEVRPLFEGGASTYEIAAKFNVNQSHIYRMIKKWNLNNPNNPIKTRDKSEAQKVHIDKHGHQRVGTSQSEETKVAISNKMRDFYDSADGKKAKQKIRETREQEWSEKTDQEKADIIQELRVGGRETLVMGQGSKFENFLAEELMLAGFGVEQRNRTAALGMFEVDIALTNEGIAIEVDGPSHFMDIYGVEELAKVQAKDKLKDDQLLSGNWSILRLQDKSGSCSRARISRVITKINEIKKDRLEGKSKVYVVKL